jgi:hypothetical protein
MSRQVKSVEGQGRKINAEATLRVDLKQLQEKYQSVKPERKQDQKESSGQ